MPTSSRKPLTKHPRIRGRVKDFLTLNDDDLKWKRYIATRHTNDLIGGVAQTRAARKRNSNELDSTPTTTTAPPQKKARLSPLKNTDDFYKENGEDEKTIVELKKRKEEYENQRDIKSEVFNWHSPSLLVVDDLLSNSHNLNPKTDETAEKNGTTFSVKQRRDQFLLKLETLSNLASEGSHHNKVSI